LAQEKEKTGQEAAYEKALRLLDRRARSSTEIRRRLEQVGFAQEAIEQTLQRLIGCGLVDDVRFARQLASTLGEGRGYGPRRIIFELGRRGISGERAEEALAGAYGEEGLLGRARRLLVKKFGADVFATRDRRLLARAQRFLLARGYNFEQVKELLHFENTFEDSEQ
jgi:regulatory protein